MIAFTSDLSGNITSFSKAAESVTGYARHEALQMNLRELVAPDFLAVVQHMTNPNLAAEGSHTYGLEVITRDGQRLALQVTRRFIRRQGRTVGIQSIARQVYETKEPGLRPGPGVPVTAAPEGREAPSPGEDYAPAPEKTEAETLTRLRNELEQKERHYSEQLNGIQESLAHETAKRERAEETLDQVQAELQILTRRLSDDIGQTRAALSHEIARRKEAIAALEKAHSEFSERERNLAADLAGARQLLSAEAETRKLAEEALEKARKDIDLQIRQQTAELSKANAVLRAQVAEHERIEEGIRKAQEELEIWYAERMADLSKVNASLKEDLAERDKAVMELQSARTDLESRLEEKLSENSRAKSIMEEEAKRRRQVEEDLQEAQSELKRRLEELRGELSKANTILQEEIGRRSRAEDALQDREDQYRKLIENATDLVFAIDLKGNFTSLNPAVERITGYNREEALGMSLTQLASPDYLEAVRRIIERQVLDEVPQTCEAGIIDRLGEKRVLEISFRPLYQEGKPSGLHGIARDITERKKMEETLRRANLKLEYWVKETEQRIREMTLLSEMGDLLRACMSVEEAYAVIIPIAEQLFQLDSGCLCLTTSRQKLVETVAVWGSPHPESAVFSWDDCWALRRGRLHQVDNSKIGLLCRHLDKPIPAAYLCVPILAHGEALGILHLRQQETWRLTETKRRLVVTVAEHVALAFSYLKLHQEVRVQSIRDPLTGLFNCRFMEESLDLALRRAERNQSPLAVIRVIVDQFESYGNQFGADAGDSLQRTIADFLRRNVRGADIACRHGQGEFTLIMPEGTLEVMRLRAEHLKESVRHLSVMHRNQAVPSATVSLGLAIFPEHGSTGRELIDSADTASKKAEMEGGDRVKTAF